MKCILSRYCLLLVVILGSVALPGTAQVWKKILPDKEPAPLVNDEDAELVLKQLREDVGDLSAPKMEGRLTGSKGEAMAGMFIEKRMADIGLAPLGKDRNFRKQFRFVSGRQLTPETRFNIGNKLVSVTEEAFPAPFSATTTEESYVLPDSREPNGPWLVPLYESAQQASTANFDWLSKAYEAAKYAEERGATSLLLYDAYGARHKPEFVAVSEFPTLKIPVMIINKLGYDKYVKPMTVIQPVYLKVAFRNDYRQGTNIVGHLNNNAPLTVVIAAHYDHIGIGSDKTIFPGADDNASGVAGMLALAQKLKAANLKKYNYVFVAFSGNEQALAGSKAFILDKQLLPVEKIAYMLNLDMVGRLQASKTVYVDGTITSNAWGRMFRALGASLKISKDMTGIGASDHYNFFDAGIPLLSFSTGGHDDEHSKQDVVGKLNLMGLKSIVNYMRGLVVYMESQPRPLFITDGEEDLASAPGSDGINVNTGLLPDYNYEGPGVRVDAVVDGKPAMKAGLKSGDILMMMGKNRIGTVNDYQQLLKSLSAGNKVIFKVKRGPTVQDFTLTL